MRIVAKYGHRVRLHCAYVNTSIPLFQQHKQTHRAAILRILVVSFNSILPLPTNLMIGDTSTKSYLDALRNINKTARARSTHSSNVPSQKVIAYQDSTTDIPKLSLPLPQAIAQSLIKAGCPLPAAKQLSDTYLRLARTVHSRYESTHRQTCNKLAYQLICDPGIISSFKQLTPIVEKQYQDEILAIERRAINRAHELQSRATQQTVLKPTFNQVCAGHVILRSSGCKYLAGICAIP